MWYRLFIASFIFIGLYLGWGIYTIYSGYAELSSIPEKYSETPENYDLTVYEFFDYECVYCREVHPTIKQAVADDGNVRYVPIPVVRGESGFTASMLAYAAAEQGKFMEMHNQLMENYGTVTENIIRDLSQELGIDYQTLAQDLENGEPVELIQDNLKVFDKMDGRATPYFLIGERLTYVPEGRMPTVDDFFKMFAEARGMDK